MKISKRTFYLVFILFAMTKTTELLANPTEYKKPKEDDLKKQLTPLQFYVTQKNGTEPAFKNEYWQNHKEGIYVDIVSGEALFSSLDKYESGTGWPSFTKPIDENRINLTSDYKLFMKRTEVRSKLSDSHLGHVFDDGPPPLGKRYCMNSAALKFIPLKEMKSQGYEKYLYLFPNEMSSTIEKATLAGGCFWSMQSAFGDIKGIVSTRVGYSGGNKINPSYTEVATGDTGHLESIEIIFNPTTISFEDILNIYWHNIDPLDKEGQFCDKGNEYHSAIFVHNTKQRKLAEKSMSEIKKKLRGFNVATQIQQASEFYPAEDYHQNYYKKNSLRYKLYRFKCKRDMRLKELKKLLGD